MEQQQTLEEAIDLFSKPFEDKPDFVTYLESFINNPETIEVYCNTLINPANELSRRYLIVMFNTYFNNNAETFINKETGFVNEQFSGNFQALLEFSISYLTEILNTDFQKSDTVVQLSTMIDFLSDKLNVNMFDFDPIIFVVVFVHYLDRSGEDLNNELYVPMIQKIAYALPFIDSIGLSYRTAYIGSCIVKEIDAFPLYVDEAQEIYSRIKPIFLKLLGRSFNDFSLCWKHLRFVVRYVNDPRIMNFKITKFLNYVDLQPQYMINFLTPFEESIQQGELDEECLIDKFKYAIGATARFLKENESFDDECFVCVEDFVTFALVGYDQSTIINQILEYTELEKEDFVMLASCIYAFTFAISLVPSLTDMYEENIIELLQLLLPASEENRVVLAIKCIHLLISSNNGIINQMSPFIVHIFENISFDLSRSTIVDFCELLGDVNSTYFTGNTENFIEKIGSLTEGINDETVDVFIVMTQFTIVTHKGMKNEDIEGLKQLIEQLFTNGDVEAKSKTLYMAVSLCEILETSGLEFITPFVAQYTDSYSGEVTSYSSANDCIYLNSFYIVRGLVQIYGNNIAEVINPLIEAIIASLADIDISSDVVSELLDFIAFLHKNCSIDFPECVGPIIEACIATNDTEMISYAAPVIKEYPEVYPLERVHEILCFYLEKCDCRGVAELLLPEFLEEVVAFVIEKCLPDITNADYIYCLTYKIASISTESLDPLFGPLVTVIAESCNEMKNKALNTFIYAMVNKTVSLEIVLQYGSILLAELQEDESCKQFAFELFAVAGLTMDYDLVSNMEALSAVALELTEEDSTKTVFEYAAIYELVLAKQLIASGSAELPGNFISLISSIRFSHIYDKLIIPIILELSQQDVLYEVTAILLARILSKPSSMFAVKDIPFETFAEVSKRIGEFQENPELSAVITQEAGQYIILLNERKMVFSSQEL